MLFVKRILNCFRKECEEKTFEKSLNKEIFKTFDSNVDKTSLDKIFNKEDFIRYIAYLDAEKDNFSKSPEYYWIEAERKINNGICLLS